MRVPVARIDPEKLTWTGEEVWVAAPRGAAIMAPKAGRVTFAGAHRTLGWIVVLRHLDGTLSAFVHLLAAPPVAVGAYVNEGDTIGHVGEAGARGAALVWRVHGTSGAYVDPRSWLRTPKGLMAFVAVCAALAVGLALSTDDDPSHRPR